MGDSCTKELPQARDNEAIITLNDRKPSLLLVCLEELKFPSVSVPRAAVIVLIALIPVICAAIIYIPVVKKLVSVLHSQ